MFELGFMNQNDTAQVAEIERICFSNPWSESLFKSELDNGGIYVVARIGDKIAGYGGMWQIVDEGHITNIAVHPHYRRQHIASSILEHLIEVATQKALCMMTLEVRVSNQAARTLYSKYGFDDVGLRRRYYENVEDAVIMTKIFR